MLPELLNCQMGTIFREITILLQLYRNYCSRATGYFDELKATNINERYESWYFLLWTSGQVSFNRINDVRSDVKHLNTVYS